MLSFGIILDYITVLYCVWNVVICVWVGAVYLYHFNEIKWSCHQMDTECQGSLFGKFRENFV